MKKQIALLLVLAMMLCMVPAVSAADANHAQVVLDACFLDTQVQVTVRLENADQVTNGRLYLRFAPNAAKLVEVSPASGFGAASVNQETPGEISFAWVGSDLAQEGAELFTAVFQPLKEEDLHYAAYCSELYAGSDRVEAQVGRTFVAWNPFTDIDGHWAEDYIVDGWHRGLVAGVSETTFAPNAEVSRAMFVSLLYRMAGRPQVRITDRFDDVPSGIYYEKAVAWAMNNRITSGTGDNLFQPNRSITRQEMACMLSSYAKVMDVEMKAGGSLDAFTDADQVSSWAVESMAWAIENHILYGTEPDLLSPRDNSTRAQAVAILCRFLNA